MPKRSFFVKDSELDDFQRKIIDKRTDNSFIVKGCAGSGKSILALWKAKQIQNENKGSYQIIVFTKALKRYMSDGIRHIGIPDANVVNFDACFYWTKEPKWERGSWKRGDFDYIIVDEAQDFSEEDIRLLKSKARKALLLYGDSAQQLYQFIDGKNTISMEQMAVTTGYQTEQLVFNHRLPKKIARVAAYISSVDDDLEGRCTNEGNEKPKIYCCRSFNAQMDKIAEIIRNRNFEDVGILFRNNEKVKQAYDYLKNKGLNVEAKINRDMDLDFNSDNPKILTYHSAKGLQFEAVFIPDCTCEDEEDRNPLYVAITRSYQSLYILHSGDLSSFFDDVPENLYETTTNNTEEL